MVVSTYMEVRKSKKGDIVLMKMSSSPMSKLPHREPWTTVDWDGSMATDVMGGITHILDIAGWRKEGTAPPGPLVRAIQDGGSVDK